MEIWKTIKDFTNYEVSFFGDVRRKKCEVVYSNGKIAKYKEKLLKQENVKGYNRVTLSQNNFQKKYQVHRLVALYFVENQYNKPCVNHKDGNKDHNYDFNLEWCTYSENENHSYKTLGKINHNRKLSNDDVVYIKKISIMGRNGNIKELAFEFSVNISTIYNILKCKYYV